MPLPSIAKMRRAVAAGAGLAGLALIVENNKAPDRAPAGHGLLSVCWEMSAAAAWMQRSDDELVARSLKQSCDYFRSYRARLISLTFVAGHWRCRRNALAFISGSPNSPRTSIRRLASNSPATICHRPGQNTAVARGNGAAANLHR